ncbi:hypothetical protein Q604_UNBC16598G0001, partial [human gut metagenome]
LADEPKAFELRPEETDPWPIAVAFSPSARALRPIALVLLAVACALRPIASEVPPDAVDD